MGGPAPAIPGFQLVSLLGRGGMGEVWKARQQGIDRWVALKILHPQYSQDEEYVRRFQREARTVGRLAHENIVRAFDCGQADGRNYLVMEFVEGEPLDRILGRRRTLPEREAFGLVRPIALALQHAWQHRIIHRDIKPQNILVTTLGVPKLCDLGLSRDLTDQTRVTQSGAIACTPAYASPEQAQGEPLDTRTDVYSLGVVLYQLVTGTLPFESASATALLLKHVNEKPAAPASRNPALTPGANRLILDMLEKHPARRPAEMGGVVARIDAILAGKEEPAGRPPKAPPTRRRRAFGSSASPAPTLAIVGGLAAAVFVVIAIAAAGSGSPPPRPPSPPPPPREVAAAPVPPPAPRPEPRPQPSPPAPAPVDRAQAALRAARSFCAANPDDLAAQIRTYESALLDLAGTPLLAEAQRELEAIRAKRTDAQAKARAEAEELIRAAMEKEDYRKAIAAWREAVAKHPDAPWASQARIDEIRKPAQERYPSLVQQAAEANRKGDAAAVETIRRRVLAWGLPGLTAGFEQAVAVPAPAPPVPPPAVPAPPPPPPAATPGRPKPPASSDLRAIRDRVRSLFKADYAKKTVEDVRALAAKLMEGARKSEDDPGTRYVFLQEARDQATRAADATLACSAVERLVVEFDVDAKREWSESLRAMAAAVRDAPGADAFVAECLGRARAATAADDYDLGAELLKAAESVASRTGDPGVAASLIQAANDLKRARTAHRAALPAFEKLKADPENAEAHLEVGRFLAFVKGDWSRGGEHLERGSDKALREAAARERTAGKEPDKLAAAAEGWIKIAGAREHALDLYRTAWPGLAADRRDMGREHFLRARDAAVTDSPPAGWFIGTGSRRELYRLDRGHSRSGRSSLRVESGGSNGWMSQGPFDTVELREYEFSAWIMTDRTEPWSLCSVFFYAGQPGPATILTGFHLNAPADQPWWTPVRVRFKAPAGATTLQVMVTHGLPKGAAWVDDLSLRAVDSEKEIVGNGTFEK